MSDENNDNLEEPLDSGEIEEPEADKQGTNVGIISDLTEQTEEFWESRSQEERRHYYMQIDSNYHTIVDEFFNLADDSVDRFQVFSKSNTNWRWAITILAGMLAILNVVVAYTAKSTNIWLEQLPLMAAVFASIIAIVTNLENLNKYGDRAQAYREVREVLLNAAREYEMLWHIYVRPFSDSPQACINAAKIYKQIVSKDQEIRGQTKELTKTRRTPLVLNSGS